MITVRPSVPAAASTSRISSGVTGLPALAKIANRRRAGTTSRKRSSRLPARSVCWNDRPVTLPPGRARLTTKPVPTGSPPAKTIGITDVACFAARTFTVPLETMTSIFCRTNSATISAARSLRPSAHRTLTATVRPSIQPSSRNRCTKAATRWFSIEAVVGLKNPMAGSLHVCRACAASGQTAAALPSSVMNSRRFIRPPPFPNHWFVPHVVRNARNRWRKHAKAPRSGAKFRGTIEGEHRACGTGRPLGIVQSGARAVMAITKMRFFAECCR